APIVAAPLAQQRPMPQVFDGDPLDTLACCPPLTKAETAIYMRLVGAATHRLQPEIAARRLAFITKKGREIAERTGLSEHTARKVAERHCGGTLLPEVALPFDDPALAGMTVADVMADPERFAGETLSDPLEGPDYGRGKAKIMRRADGSL